MDDPLTYHLSFTPEDFDAGYNLRARRPDFEETVTPVWEAKSAEARASIPCQLDIGYGPGPKQKLDVFSCGNADAPTLVYIHGGYWQRGDKALYSFIATPFVAAGAHVVTVGYDLCPDVTITQIVDQLRDAMAFLWREAPTLGLNRDRIAVVGHSAGGHLTQMLMATDWSARASDLPRDMLFAGIPISPLSYLEPVRLTKVLNDGIRMDAEEAEAQSPMTCHPPATNAPQMVVVGGAETEEFHRQAQMYVDRYATPERPVTLCMVPDVDHFDVLNVLTDPNAPAFAKVRALLEL